MRTSALLLFAVAACSGRSTSGLTATPTDPSGDDDDGVTEETGTVWRCDTFEPLPEGGALRDGDRSTDTVEACGERLHAVVGAAGSRYEVEVVEWFGESPLTLELRDWNGARMGGAEGLTTASVVPLTLSWSGEHALVVGTEDGRPGTYNLELRCLEGCDLLTTRYPVVLFHGMAGTDEFLDGLEYYYDVRSHFEPLGYAVHTPYVDPFRPTPDRAAQWAGHLDTLFASGQARRVNVIGHSQGGLDARYVASKLDPDRRVRSVTTISTPHRGAAIADLAWGLVDASVVGEALVDAAFDELAGLYGPRGDQDIVGQLEQLTSDASAQFNLDVPDRTDIPYASWAGRTCQLLDVICQADNGWEVAAAFFGATHLLTQVLQGDNDGLVSVESAKWGEFLGELPADHLDEVGLFPGTQAPDFDHLAFFAAEFQRLTDAGL